MKFYQSPLASEWAIRSAGVLCTSTGIANLTVNDLSGDVTFDEV